MYIHLDAEITQDGELRVQLPDDLPPGKVKLAIEYQSEMSEWDDESILHDLLTVEPLTGTEIIAAGYAGGWQDLEIVDSEKWVAEQRERRRGQRSW